LILSRGFLPHHRPLIFAVFAIFGIFLPFLPGFRYSLPVLKYGKALPDGKNCVILSRDRANAYLVNRISNVIRTAKKQKAESDGRRTKTITAADIITAN